MTAKSVRRNGKVQSVIFDMDGVIIDSHPAHRKAWKDFLQTFGKEVSESELSFILDGRKRRDILRHFLGDVSEQELVEYGKKKDGFFQQVSLEVNPVPGVIDFIDDLRHRGITLAIATSASETRTLSTLKRLGLTDHFAVVVTGDDVTDSKPDPTIYSLVCNRLRCEARNSVAIEDAVSGIRAAKEAGLTCIGVGGPGEGEKLRAAGADHVIENFMAFSLHDLKFPTKRLQPSVA